MVQDGKEVEANFLFFADRQIVLQCGVNARQLVEDGCKVVFALLAHGCEQIKHSRGLVGRLNEKVAFEIVGCLLKTGESKKSRKSVEKDLEILPVKFGHMVE